MFARPSPFRSRFAVAAAGMAMVATAAPLMGAGPEDWRIDWSFGRDKDRDRDRGRDHDRGRGRDTIVIRPSFPAPRPQLAEVLPANLSITAFQYRDTIMIHATGENRNGGFTTSLSTIDVRCAEPILYLTNIGPTGFATQACAPFSINGAIRVEREVKCISVRIAGQSVHVPVTCVQGL